MKNVRLEKDPDAVKLHLRRIREPRCEAFS